MSATFVLPFTGELDGTTGLPIELLYKTRPRPEGDYTPMERRAFYPDGYEPSPLVTPFIDIGVIDPLQLIENTRGAPNDQSSGPGSYILNLAVCPTDNRQRAIVQVIAADGCLRFPPFILPVEVTVQAVQYLAGTRYAIPIVTGDSIRILWDPTIGPFPGGGIITASLLPSDSQEANFEELLVNMTTTSGAGGGGRLAFNPAPTIGGVPGAFTYTAILDEAITFTDFGAFPPNTFDVMLPDISTASAGQQIGVLFSGGNPNWTLSFVTTVTDSIVNPSTGATGPPGFPLSIPPGTYSDPVFLVFEAEQAGGPNPPTWQYVGDRVASAVSAARLDEVLVAGPNSNGSSAYFNLEDEVHHSFALTPLVDPAIVPPRPGYSFQPHGKTTRSTTIASVDGSTFVDIGSRIIGAGGAPDGAGNYCIVRAWARRQEQTGAGGVTAIAVLEEIWLLSFGVWGRVETLVASAQAGVFRFNATGTDLFLQGLDDVTNNVSASAVIEYLFQNGYVSV